ncbi:hypothetical protein Bbelb_419750 [Branchiostoma belcheri]|nr:hypothetical protein Bbelb_419750 [Branchiostoma belcheri]
MNYSVDAMISGLKEKWHGYDPEVAEVVAGGDGRRVYTELTLVAAVFGLFAVPNHRTYSSTTGGSLRSPLWRYSPPSPPPSGPCASTFNFPDRYALFPVKLYRRNHHLLVRLLRLPYTHLRPQPTLHSSLGLTLTLPGRYRTSTVNHHLLASPAPQTTRPTLPGQPPSYRYYAPTDPAAGLPVTWYQPPAVPSPSSPPHLKTPLPAAFLGNGDEDFPVWLTKFEVYADAHLYDATVRSRALPTFLDGPALTYFQSLPQETKHDYQHLCQALSHAFSQDKYIFSFQQSLAQRKRQPGESLIVFASELKHLVRRAHRTYNEAAIQGVTLQHFIQGIDSATRLRVIERNPSTIDQAVEIATLYEQAVAATTPRERSVNAVHRDDLQATVTTLTEQVSALTTLLQNHLSLTSGDSHRSASTSRPRRHPLSLPVSLSGHPPQIPIPFIRGSPFTISHTRCPVSLTVPHLGSPFPFSVLSPPLTISPQHQVHVAPVRKRRAAGQTGRPPVEHPQAQTSSQLPGSPTAHVTATLDGHATQVLIDTGSALSLISEDLRDAIPSLRQSPLIPTVTPAKSVTGHPIDVLGILDVHIYLGSHETTHPILVVRGTDQPAILGWDFCTANQVVIDTGRGILTIGDTTVPLLTSTDFVPRLCHASVCRITTIPPRSVMAVPISLKPRNGAGNTPHNYVGLLEPRNHDDRGLAVARTVASASHSKAYAEVTNTSDQPVVLQPNTPMGTFWALEDDDVADYIGPSTPNPAPTHPPTIDLQQSELSPAQAAQLRKLVDTYADVFSAGSRDRGRTKLTSHRIHTGDCPPIKQRPHRTPLHRQAEIHRQVDAMLADDVIEPSQSPWASPVVLARKKDGSFRFCVDYRKLNQATVKDAHPLPRTDVVLDALAGSAFFTTLDLTSGYWQVNIDPDDREKTAFTTGRGLYQFKVMPFGLTNAPSTFQRLMELLLAGLDWQTCLAYLDDIIVFSRTFQEHLTTLEEVFRRFRTANLKLNAKKCQFAQPRVRFLGHIVSKAGIQPDPTNTEKVRQWPTPTSTAEIRAFLGLASYYRKFIQNFAHVADPLIALTRKHVAFTWDDACQTAFDTLRAALVAPPVLAYPDFTASLILYTDASNSAIGAVLTQPDDSGERVISYASKTLTKQERNWSTYDRELWAVVWSIRHYRSYLAGQSFSVVTDHKPLVGLSPSLISNDPTGRRARWAIELSTYDFTITYRAGKSHNNADAMSRRPTTVRDINICADAVPATAATKPRPASPQTVTQAAPQPLTLPTAATGQGTAPKSLPPTVAAVDDQPNQQEVNPADSPLTPDNLRRAQEADPDISTVLQWKRGRRGRPPFNAVQHRGRYLKSLWHQYPDLTVKNGILHRRWRPNSRVLFQRVAPKALVPVILRELHNGPLSGHLGPAKTLRRVYIRFYWPGMTQEVKRWCRSCTKCATRATPTPSARAPMQPIQASHPFEKVAMDLTELPLSKKGNRYCLVVQDFFTKYTNAYPLMRQDAATVAQVLFTHYIREHGVPQSLHSDQGRQFESTVMKNLYAALGIRKTRTTPYHPQCDGLVERFNRTLKEMLTKYVSESGDDWDDHLPHVLLAYNTSVHASTGFTPFYLTHGREATLPADILMGAAPTPQSLSSLRTAFRQVRRNAQSASARQKLAYDAKISHHVPYQAGDRVWLHDPTTARQKLKPKWKGPYTVTDRLTPDGVTYRLRDPDGRTQVVHYNRLKRCFDPPQGTTPTTTTARGRQVRLPPSDNLVKPVFTPRLTRVWSWTYFHPLTDKGRTVMREHSTELWHLYNQTSTQPSASATSELNPEQ